VKTIVVLDSLWIGHIPTYHRILVERLLSLGHRVISISPKPQNLKWEIKDPKKDDYVFLKEFTEEVRLESGVNHFERSVRWWKNCNGNVESAVKATHWQPDLVLLPGIENNIISSSLTGDMVDGLFPFKWFGLYLTPKYLRKPFLKFQHKRLFRKDRFFEAKNCIALAILDDGVVSRLQKILKNKKIMVMPDFTSTETATEKFSLAEEMKNKAGDRKIIGLFGELSSRKGLITFLEMARRALIQKLPLFFVFVGPLNHRNNSPEDLVQMKQEISRASPNCFFHLERIPKDACFNDLFKECDIIFAAYINFYHSSNMMTKASFFEKPIIVSEGYCMAERVRKFQLGTVIPKNNGKVGLRAINQLLKGEDLNGLKISPQYKLFSSLHSLERLDDFLKDLIALISGETPIGE